MGGLLLRPVEIQLGDGRFSMHFSATPGEGPTYAQVCTTPRVIYRKIPRPGKSMETVYLGQSTPDSMRGAGIGREMLRWFVNHEDAQGTPVTRTGQVNKPVIALLLRNAGFIPDSVSAVAEIVSSAQSPRPVPTIRWIRLDDPGAVRHDQSPTEAFYTVKPGSSTYGIGKIRDERKVVALHTTYRRSLH